MSKPAARTAAGLRLRRTRTAPRPEQAAAGAKPRTGAILRAALWFGMLTGIVEVGLVLALKPLHDRTPGFFHLNRHLVWMIPLFHATLFGAGGLLLACLARLRSRF